MYTIPTFKHHQSMAMRVKFGTPLMCIAIDMLERRTCVLVSSGVNMSLAVPNLAVSVRSTAMISKALIEQIH